MSDMPKKDQVMKKEISDFLSELSQKVRDLQSHFIGAAVRSKVSLTSLDQSGRYRLIQSIVKVDTLIGMIALFELKINTYPTTYDRTASTVESQGSVYIRLVEPVLKYSSI